MSALSDTKSWSRNPLSPQIEYLAGLCLKSSTGQPLIDDLLSLCRETMPNEPEQSIFCDKTGVLEGENMAAVLKIAIMNKDYSFFEDAASHFSLQVPSVFFTWAGQWMEGDGSDPQERLALLRQG